jgi:5-(carboxyamino)imidazole ribonucleotide mutase
MARNAESPDVGIIMGSYTDHPSLDKAVKTLQSFDVPFERRVISAHRTPEKVKKYGNEAVERGLKVIIAAAGGSAHLPGMVASETRLPVLGVAVQSSTDSMNAALGSMLFMPNGKPLSTMGVATKEKQPGSENAALQAIRILALSNPELASKYEDFDRKLGETVLTIDDMFQEFDVDNVMRELIGGADPFELQMQMSPSIEQ